MCFWNHHSNIGFVLQKSWNWWPNCPIKIPFIVIFIFCIILLLLADLSRYHFHETSVTNNTSILWQLWVWTLFSQEWQQFHGFYSYTRSIFGIVNCKDLGRVVINHQCLPSQWFQRALSRGEFNTLVDWRHKQVLTNEDLFSSSH